jgi:hypothetical protein
MEQQHPKIYDNNVEVFLQPRKISLIGQTDQSYRFLGTQVKFVALHQLVSGFIVPLLISFVLPVTFEIAAYTYLLRRGADLFTVGGAVLSGMIVILTLSLGYVTTWVPMDAGPQESGTR